MKVGGSFTLYNFALGHFCPKGPHQENILQKPVKAQKIALKDPEKVQPNVTGLYGQISKKWKL